MTGVGCILPDVETCSASVVFNFPNPHGGGSLDDGVAFCTNQVAGNPNISVLISPPSALGCGGRHGRVLNLHAGACAPGGGPGGTPLVCFSYVGVRCSNCNADG